MEKDFVLWDTMSMAETFANFVRKHRKAAGLTQQELADQLEMTNRIVSDWERGKGRPGRDAIPRLARVFDVGADELWQLIDGKKAQQEAAREAAAAAGVYDAIGSIDTLATSERARLARIIAVLAHLPDKLDLWLRHGELLIDDRS